MSRGYDDPPAKVYIGDLDSSATEKEIEDAFTYYGPIKHVFVARNPPGFAFVEFDDSRDAEDAVKGLNGSTICGCRARVEMARGRRRGGRGGGRGGGGGYGGRRGGGGYGGGDDRCYECGESGHFARDCRDGGSRRRRDRSRS